VALYEDAHKFSDLHPKYGEVPPLLAVEVLSPSDRLSGIISKVNDYLQSGVTLVWVVDPQNRDVTVFRPGKPAYTVVTSQELTGMEVLPDFHCRVANFFYLPAEMPAEKTASS
jgi:Uma2 family endonuclease